MDRDRGADDAGSEHDDIGVRQEDLRCGCLLRLPSIVCACGGRATRPDRFVAENAIPLNRGDALGRRRIEQLSLHLDQLLKEIVACNIRAAAR